MAGENLANREWQFDLFVRQPLNEPLTHGRLFHRLLCKGVHERESTGGDEPEPTLAHLIPKSLGGKWETLA